LIQVNIIEAPRSQLQGIFDPQLEFYFLCPLTPRQATGNQSANCGELGEANALAGIQEYQEDWQAVKKDFP
jgi:hypothetical protein